jgi:molecular chaperone GrpE
MKEKNNKNEDLIQGPDKGDDNELNKETDINSDAETSGAKEDLAVDLEQEVVKLNDKYLRLYSEFDNYRKRSLKERIELSKSAASDLITTLLPVLDDFERALNAMETGEDKENAIKEGITHVYTKLKNILALQGLELMKVMGEEFNTDFHEAITNIPAPTPDQKGKVVDVIQNGYLLNGKVIRYAKVVVGA